MRHTHVRGIRRVDTHILDLGNRWGEWSALSFADLIPSARLCSVLPVHLKGGGHLEEPSRRREDNIKINIKLVVLGDLDWIYLLSNRI